MEVTQPKFANEPSGISYMDIDEFVNEGYLQEVNRRLFHPLGLALIAVKRIDGRHELKGIWDCRNDPEGILFSENITKMELFKTRKQRFDELLAEKLEKRHQLIGYGIQSCQ